MIYDGSVRLRAAIVVVAVLAPIAFTMAGCGDLLGIGSVDPPPPPNGSSGGPNPDGSAIPLREDCIDGKDNDGDGLVDCADPDCTQAGYACRIAPPDGWELVELHRSPWDKNRPNVPSPCVGASEQRLAGPQNEAGTTCATCTCVKKPCDVMMTCGDAVDCNQVSGNTAVYLVHPGCSARQPTGIANTMCKLGIEPSADPCTPEGAPPDPTLPLLPPWKEDVTVCRSSNPSSTRGGVGCAAPGEACLPTSVSAGQVCIRNVGAPKPAVCPGEWPMEEGLYPPGTADQRSCTPCACGPSMTAVTCDSASTAVMHYLSTNCTTGNLGSLGFGSCQAVDTSGPWSTKLDMPPASTAVCPPLGGIIEGMVARVDRETVCCAP